MQEKSVYISKAPGLIKEIVSSIMTQAQDEISDRVLQGVGFRRQEEQAEKEQNIKSQVVQQHGSRLGEKFAESKNDLVPQDSKATSSGQNTSPASTSDITG